MLKNKNFWLSVACAIYALFALYSMVIKGKVGYSITCEGILLDSAKCYQLANNMADNEHYVQIPFPQSANIMPAYLGNLQYSKESKSYVWINAKDIILPNNIDSNTVHYPICKSFDKDFNPVFFGAEDTISESFLLKGIRFNLPCGLTLHRVPIRIKETAFGKVLFSNTEAIGVCFQILMRQDNYFEVVCNLEQGDIKSSAFYFDKMACLLKNHKIKIEPGFFNCKVFLDNQRVHLRKNQFTVESSIFSIKRTLPIGCIFLIFFTVISVAVFQYLLLCQLDKINPILHAVVGIRIGLNNLFFLSLPILVMALSKHEGRWLFCVTMLMLNASFLIKKDKFYLFAIYKSKYQIFGLAIVFFITIAIIAKNDNEAFYRIPILFLTKFLVILLTFSIPIIQVEIRQYKMDIRYVGIWLYALTLSIITHDFGTCIYTTLAFLILLYFKIPRTKYVVVVVLILFLIGFPYAKHHLNDKKVFRLYAPYLSLSSKYLGDAPLEDKETVAFVRLHSKSLLFSDQAHFENAAIPSRMKNIFHTDYVFFWSWSIGGYWFFVLFFAVVMDVCNKIGYLLLCLKEPFNFDKNKVFITNNVREAGLVSFLLAIQLVAIVFPFLSNLGVLPLTGQSIPCLSISWIEILMIIIVFILLENFFGNPSFYQEGKVSINHQNILQKWMQLKRNVFLMFGLVLIVAFIKMYHTPETITIATKPKNQHPIMPFPQLSEDSFVFPDSLRAFWLDVCANRNSNTRFEDFYASTTNHQMERIKCNDQTKLRYYISTDSFQVNGKEAPYGNVFAFYRQINKERKLCISNVFYNQMLFPKNGRFNADLHALCNQKLMQHLHRIGEPTNFGAVLILDNHTGQIIVSASYPFNASSNAKNIAYPVGSVKKILLAHLALQIEPSLRYKTVNGKSFQQFVQTSDGKFAAFLLDDLLKNHPREFEEQLWKNFQWTMSPEGIHPSFLDASIEDILNEDSEIQKNKIYRLAIGRQQPFSLEEIVSVFARIISSTKVDAWENVNNHSPQKIKVDKESLDVLKASMQLVLKEGGTAERTGEALDSNKLPLEAFYAKTGTAESEQGKDNVSSTFIIANGDYTIGIMECGKIPINRKQLSAQDLFIQLIPIFRKYKIFTK